MIMAGEMKIGEFIRFKCNENIMTLRKEESGFIVMEPESFDVYFFTNLQANILIRLIDKQTIEEIAMSISTSVDQELIDKIAEFKNRCINKRLLEGGDMA